MLEGIGLKGEPVGTGDIVVRQVPAPGKRLEEGDVVQLVLNSEEADEPSGKMLVPDVRGLSLRRAINRLVVDDFDVRVRGSGVVVEQVPSAGHKTQAGATVHLVCEPRTMRSVSLY
jgi:beta-lactam-binding protein with PASTA domain